MDTHWIYNCPGAFGVLHLLTAYMPLQRSLEELWLWDSAHRLSEAKLWGLQGLARLSSLTIVCEQLQGSFSDATGVPTQKISSLRRLVLRTWQMPRRDQLAVLPGCMTQLTHLDLWTRNAISAQQQVLAKAISRLTNLQHLGTNYALMTPEAQRQSLGRLQQLTHLELKDGLAQEPLVVLPQLSSLVELHALGTVVRSPFPHPTLQKLHALAIQHDPPAAGQPLPLVVQQALDCPLQELELGACHGDRPAADASLQHLPELPELRALTAYLQPGDDGRYRHLAALLHRQARTLQELRLVLAAPFEEALPCELPACRVLEIAGASRHTLQLLATCRLPALQELRLRQGCSSCSTSGLDAELDFGWLRGLPSLKELHLFSGDEGFEGLRQAVFALLQGSGVEVTDLAAAGE